MEKEKLMLMNVGYLNVVHDILYDNRKLEFKNCNVVIKSIEVILDSAYRAYKLLNEITDIIIDIQEYHTCIDRVLEDYEVYQKTLDESCMENIKNKLFSIIKKLSSIGVAYEDIPHTYCAYVIIDRYVWSKYCDNHFILQASKKAILHRDELVLNKLFSSLFNFIMQYSKDINKLHADVKLKNLITAMKEQKASIGRLEELFCRINTLHINKTGDAVIDVALKVSLQIIGLMY